MFFYQRFQQQLEGTRTIYECPFTSESHQELTHVQSVLLKQAPGARYDLSSKRKERQLWKYDAKSDGYDLQSTCRIGKPINA